MTDETVWDAVVLDAATASRTTASLQVHNVIFDTFSVGMERRYLANGIYVLQNNFNLVNKRSSANSC